LQGGFSTRWGLKENPVGTQDVTDRGGGGGGDEPHGLLYASG